MAPSCAHSGREGFSDLRKIVHAASFAGNLRHYLFLDAEVAASSDVEVISEDQVGPFDTAIITSEDPEAVITWLRDNDYDVSGLGASLIAPYVEDGFFFVALRLAKDRDVGDIQPLALTYEAEMPGIPIRLTAVATEADLGVTAWVLGQNRAIPDNYLHVEINEARIDWLNGGFNYTAVTSTCRRPSSTKARCKSSMAATSKRWNATGRTAPSSRTSSDRSTTT